MRCGSHWSHHHGHQAGDKHERRGFRADGRHDTWEKADVVPRRHRANPHMFVASPRCCGDGRCGLFVTCCRISRRLGAESPAGPANGGLRLAMFDTPTATTHPRGVRSILKRVASVVCVLTFAQGAAGLCAGWQSTLEARMQCQDDACPLHRHEHKHGTSRTQVTEAAADDCCALSPAPESSQSAAAFASTITRAVLQSLPPVVLSSEGNARLSAPWETPLAADARFETPAALRPARLATHSRRVSTRVAFPGGIAVRSRGPASVTSVVAHDQSTHRTLAEESVHRAGPVRRPRGLGLVGARRDAHRRDTRPLGQPGHRLHGLAGSQPAGGRRPGQLSADGEPAGTRRRSRRPLAVGVRLLDDLRRLRRQRGPVLRARSRPRAHEPGHQEPAGGRRANARPGRDGRRARLLVHGGEPHAVSARPAQPAGLVHPLSAQRRPRRRRSGVGRRPRPAVPDRRRSESPPDVQPAARRRGRRGPRQQPECRRQRAGFERRLVDRARRRADRSRSTTSSRSWSARRAVCRSTSSRWRTCTSATRFAWPRSSTARRKRSAASSSPAAA